MKKLTCGALALTMTCAAGYASDSDWPALDEEVGALASTLGPDGGASISGRVSAGYLMQDPATDGFSVADARLAIDGESGDYGYHVETDFADEGLRAAYASFGIGEHVSARIGRFHASICYDTDLDEGSMKHFSHSVIGGAFTGFSSGIGMTGEITSDEASQMSWAISIMNGGDGGGDELLTSLRVVMELIDASEGGMNVSASIAAVDDAANEDTGATIIEVNAGNGTWGIGIETARVGDGTDFDSNGDSINDSNTGSGSLAAGADTTGVLAGGSSPMVVSLSYRISSDWEIALRGTDMDDGVGTTNTEVTASHYLDGHARKWQVGITRPDNDAGTAGEDALMIGLNVAF